MRFKGLGSVIRACAPDSPDQLHLVTQLPYANKRATFVGQSRKRRCIPCGHIRKRVRRSNVSPSPLSGY